VPRYSSKMGVHCAQQPGGGLVPPHYSSTEVLPSWHIEHSRYPVQGPALASCRTVAAKSRKQQCAV
jgi:hypothetical protein